VTQYSNQGDGVMNIGGTMGHVVAGRGNRQDVVDGGAGSLEALAAELRRLHQAVAAAHPAHDEDAAAVKEAAAAASKGDEGLTRAALGRASSWLLRLAETLGVELVVRELRELLPH
jgi:hypothetical protein